MTDSTLRDIRYGFRTMRRSPGFTALAVLSLALGIGANTALFSVADEVLFKSLPVRDPGQLVLFSWTSGPKLLGGSYRPGVYIDPQTGTHRGRSFSYLTFEGFRNARGGAVSDVFAFTSMFRANGIEDVADSPSGQFVSGNYYSALGLEPFIGRLISPEDDRDDALPVMVISHRHWEQGYGRDPAVVGKTVALGKTVFTIMGVTPAGFSGTQDLGEVPDYSIPIAMASQIGDIGPKFTDRMKKEPWLWAVMIMGRMKPGSTYDDVRADLQGVFYSTGLEGWNANPGKNGKQTPDPPRLELNAGGKGITDTRQGLSRVMAILMAIVGLVLLIVCSNLANLLLARAATRRKEIAVRLALGASRARLVRQLLTESLMLAVCGASLGIIFALWGKDIFLAWITRANPSFIIEPQVDPRVLLFTICVTLLTGLLVGVVPAVRATRVDISQRMKDGGGASNISRSVIGRTLVVTQVAISVVLLISAGLFVRTLVNLQTTDVGFNTNNLLVFEVYPRFNIHKRPAIAALYTRVIERVRGVPGVREVTTSGYPLLSGDLAMPFIVVPGYVREAGEDPTLHIQRIWPNFFETMEMPLLQGRNLTREDAERIFAGGQYVAVVNETLARKYFGDANPIGRRFGFTKDVTARDVPSNEQLEIVGLVRDAKFASVRQDVPPTAFLPFYPDPVTFEVRTVTDPLPMIESIRKAVQEVDPDLRLWDFRTQADQARLTFARERHFAFLSSLFGLLALLLASIGLYGVLSFNVANRVQEIGIRIALGAQRSHVIGMVMRETAWLMIIGISAGLIVARTTTRLIASMLYGLTPNDPAAIVVAVLLLIVVAALAVFLPARRASKVDPIVGLRCE